MITYKLTNTQYNEFFIGILIFFTLVFGRDTLLCNVLIGFELTQFITLFVFSLYLFVFLLNNFKHINAIIKDSRTIIFIGVSILILFVMIIKRDFTFTYLSVIFAFGCSIFMSFFINLKQFSKYFVYTILFLTVYSLIANYILRDFIFSNISNMSILTNSANSEFVNLFFTFLYNQESYYRNFCIFREPGVFQFFLIFAILFETYFLKHSVRKKFTIVFFLCLGMISTFSTTGFIALILYFLVLILNSSSNFIINKKQLIIFSLIILVTLACFTLMLSINKDLYWTFKPMITKLYTFNSSLTARLESITANLNIIWHHFWLGSDVSSVLYAARHNTASTLIMYSIFGSILGTLYMFMWLLIPIYIKPKVFSNNIKSYIVYGMLFIIIFISFNSENIITNLYFTAIPIIILSKNNKLNEFFRKKLVVQSIY